MKIIDLIVNFLGSSKKPNTHHIEEPRRVNNVVGGYVDIFRHCGSYYVRVTIPQSTLGRLYDQKKTIYIFERPLSDNWGQHGYVDTGLFSHHPETRMMEHRFQSRASAEEAYYKAKEAIVGHVVPRSPLHIREVGLSDCS